MASELIPGNLSGRATRAKDVLIALLALSLCICMVALIHEIQKHQEYQKLYSGQVEKLRVQQQASAQSLAAAEQNKIQSERALRRAQLAMKACNEARGIALQLQQNGGRLNARSH